MYTRVGELNDDISVLFGVSDTTHHKTRVTGVIKVTLVALQNPSTLNVGSDSQWRCASGV